MLGRQYGLASDQIVALDLVDANGNLITADTSNNSDLLFASQGAPGLDHASVTALLHCLSPVWALITDPAIMLHSLRTEMLQGKAC